MSDDRPNAGAGAALRVASWNVNSIRARLDVVAGWLDAQAPDVLCMQETKVADADFPRAPFEERGYRLALCGQPSYNGVAIAARVERFERVDRGLGDAGLDAQARFVSVVLPGGLRVASAYVPNGQQPDSDKYAFKLRWLERLRAWLDANVAPGQRAVLAGDFNIALDDLDVHAPQRWRGTVLYRPELSAWLQRLLDSGWVDVVRMHHPEGHVYSWWDYRGRAWQLDEGLRIDYVLATPPLADACRAAWIDRDARRGRNASDHAPVVAEFA